MSEAGADDKPFEASERKLRQAREKGDIPRSTEVNALAAYLGLLAALAVAGPIAARWLAGAGTASALDAATRGEAFDAARRLAAAAGLGAMALLALPAVAVLAALVVQRGIVFTPSRLAPDIKRIDPFGNSRQKFGTSGLVTFALSLAKATAAVAGGWLLFRQLLGLIADAGYMTEAQWIPGLALVLRRVLMLAVAISAVLAAADLLWKRFDHRRKLRMTRQEAEEEHKESEGDPHFKALRRQRAVDIALGSMLADVARADVVITNPTHYAVALEWKRGSGRAPVCLAKGTDEVARRIRERAAEHRIPIWPDPPCARALHATTEIGAEIPVEQFAAVAAAIRFAEAMRRKVRAGW